MLNLTSSPLLSPFVPGLRSAAVPGGRPAVWRGGVALRPAEEGLRPVSRRGGERLHLPRPLQANAGPQAPVQSLHGETVIHHSHG